MLPKQDTTMLQAKARFLNRPTVTGGKRCDKFFVYIPTQIARDSLFPFKEGDEVQIKVDPKQKRVIVQRA